jgi:hypothetical protein
MFADVKSDAAGLSAIGQRWVAVRNPATDKAQRSFALSHTPEPILDFPAHARMLGEGLQGQGDARVRAVVIMLTLQVTAGLLTVSQPLRAQESIDPEFLAAIQGRWITRFEGKDTEIEIVGREGRIVKIAPVTIGKPGSQYTPKPGDAFMIITSAKKKGSITSRVDGREIPNFEYTARAYVDYNNGWRMSPNSYPANLTAHVSTCSEGLSTVYLYDFYTLSVFASAAGSEYFRPDIKQRWLDNMADANITRRGDWRECAKTGPGAPGNRAATSRRPKAAGQATAPTTRFTPPASTAAAAATTGVRPVTPVPPAGTLSVPVTSPQQQVELAKREQLNKEQAAFAAQQVAANKTAQDALDRATREREAMIARQDAEYQRALAAQRAEVDRIERMNAEALAKWRADVEACKRGDKSRCAPSPK